VDVESRVPLDVREVVRAAETHAAKSFTLHVNGRRSYIRGQSAQPLFDDSRTYLDPALPEAGVDVPDTNTRIRVLSSKGTSMRIRVGVG
jgi:immune inhibitor A